MFIKRGDGKILTVIKSTSEDDAEISPELEALAKDKLERAKNAIKPADRPTSIKVSPKTEK